MTEPMTFIHGETHSVQAHPEPIHLLRIRLRAKRRVLWLRHLWIASQMEAERGGTLHTEVDRILATSRQTLLAAERAFYAHDAEARTLHGPILMADQQMEADPIWQRLRSYFDLSSEEIDLLSLAIVAETDPTLKRVYSYLLDETSPSYPTPYLAAELFEWHTWQGVGAHSPSVYWHLMHPARAEGLSPGSLATPWMADPDIAGYIMGHLPATDGVLGSGCMATTSHWRQPLFPELLVHLREFVVSVLGVRSTEPASVHAPISIEIELVGAPGTGRRTLAAQLCRGLGHEVYIVDAQALMGAEVSPELAVERGIRAIRLARLKDAILYWHGADAISPTIWNALPPVPGLTLFGVEAARPSAIQGNRVRRSYPLPALSRQQRLAVWSANTTLPAPVQISEWSLRAGEVVTAAHIASSGPEATLEVCRQMLRQQPGELISPLPCPYTKEDLVLAPGIQQHLNEFEQQARLRSQVYDEWGFGQLVPLGRGITALFAGPSGTGKTMAAQVIARVLDKELFRVDLAGVVNKYIGETEKRLKQVFDACERADVLLFFDEADALFGQRTEVKDAHDRFANIEIDYLLQRMEQFNGVAILATNRKADMDSAFLRRLRFIIDFTVPGPEERKRLWHKALPANAPDGTSLLEPLDWNFLSRELNLTGAEIKSAAIGAAFLARGELTRGESARIGMRHILHAVRREITKQGGVVRPGDWEGYQVG